MIKLIVNGDDIPFETTIFPDGTSQVWKVAQDLDGDDDIEILWLFESEAELFHVCQLAQLTQAMSEQEDSTLIVPYLPYGRQDKEISNKSSFSLKTFKDILYNVNICRIETFDAHSKSDMIYPMEAVKPSNFHRHLINVNRYDLICYPDKGAAQRYMHETSTPFIYCEKVRDQLTGNITGLFIVGAERDKLTNKKILIIDDICDGGMTFIKVSEALQTFNPKQVDLAVSHGLFTKGKQCLHDAGISNIYTTNSLLRNPEGFKVW